MAEVGKFEEVVDIRGGTTPSTTNPEFWDGKRGAAIGLFQLVVAGQETREKLIEVINMLRNTSNPQVEFFINVMKKWGEENGYKF